MATSSSSSSSSAGSSNCAEAASSPDFPSRRLSTIKESEEQGSSSVVSSLGMAASFVSTGRGEAFNPHAISRAASTIFLPGKEAGRKIICAVNEGRDSSPVIGLAFVDIALGRVVLTQVSESQCYSHTMRTIMVHEPRDFVVETSTIKDRSILTNHIIEELQKQKVTPQTQNHVVGLDRKYWRENVGIDQILRLSVKEKVAATLNAVSGKYYANCAFAAAMTFLEGSAGARVYPQSLDIEFQPLEDSVMIDAASIQSLELLQNSDNPKSDACLIGLLNRTVTPMGARHLRRCLLQPSTQAGEVIVPRQEAVGELATNEEIFNGVRTALKPLREKHRDLEKVIAKIIFQPGNNNVLEIEQSVNYVLKIKSFMECIPTIFNALQSAQSSELVRIRNVCSTDIAAKILGVLRGKLVDNATIAEKPLQLKHQRIGAVKEEGRGLLYRARVDCKEAEDNIYDYVHRLNNTYGLVNETRYDSGSLFFLRFVPHNFYNIDPRISKPTFIRARDKGGFVECTTLKLETLNLRLKTATDEVMKQSDEVIKQLISDLREHIPSMIGMCKAIGHLDMLASFAHVATDTDYIRPQFSEILALDSARHPVMEKELASSPRPFVPNDCYASAQYRCQIITGRNMSGKSTYMKTVGVIQIMAQIGCFVPATTAALPIVQKIFTRTSKDDNIEANLSTFSVEMQEMAYILRHIDDRSLAIVDELGRGSSSRDGLSIAMAIAEILADSEAITLFSTHFAELAKIVGQQPKVLNLHLQSEESTVGTGGNVSPAVTMLHKICFGLDGHERYGIELARAMELHQCIADAADDYAGTISPEDKDPSAGNHVQSRRALTLALKEALLVALDSEISEKELAQKVDAVREEFMGQMTAAQAPVASIDDTDSFDEFKDLCDDDGVVYDEDAVEWGRCVREVLNEKYDDAAGSKGAEGPNGPQDGEAMEVDQPAQPAAAASSEMTGGNGSDLPLRAYAVEEPLADDTKACEEEEDEGNLADDEDDLVVVVQFEGSYYDLD